MTRECEQPHSSSAKPCDLPRGSPPGLGALHVLACDLLDLPGAAECWLGAVRLLRKARTTVKIEKEEVGAKAKPNSAENAQVTGKEKGERAK